MAAHTRRPNILPGYRLSLGMGLFWLSLIILAPLAALVARTATMPPHEFWKAVSDERALAAYRLTFGTAFAAALVNLLFGGIVAWVLARYRFPGSRLVDGLVDLPFALPTAVAGICLTALYSKTGPIGHALAHFGIDVAYTPLGIIVALTFVGLPFMVRTVQPVLEDLDPEIEEAAAGLGAGRLQVFRRVLLPILLPPALTGFALSFARSLGEYGSVVFIAGNMPLRTEIAPLLIMGKLEQFDYNGAAAIAMVLLVVSFVLLTLINALQRWAQRRTGI